MGRFVRGQSGNPRGRAKGSRNRRSLVFEQLLNEGGEDLIVKALEMARGGDRLMLKIILEKLLPKQPGACVEVELPKVERAADVVVAVATVIQHATDGTLTLPEARALLEMLDVQRRSFETAEMVERLEELETLGKELQR